MEINTSVTPETVLYLYGFVLPAIGPSGLTGVEEGSDVFFVDHDEIGCAVSLVPACHYRRPAGEWMPSEQAEWLTPRAWRHHEVLHRLHAAGTVVPMKFGTLCGGLSDVRGVLSRFHETIEALLGRFHAKDEWGLTIALDEEALAAALRCSHPELVAMEQEQSHVSEGRAYFVRKKIQTKTAGLVASELAAVEEGVYRQLADAGIEITAAPRSSDKANRMASRAALLVERHRFGELESGLSRLEATLAGSHVSFELSGPWPPYSFATQFETGDGSR